MQFLLTGKANAQYCIPEQGEGQHKGTRHIVGNGAKEYSKIVHIYKNYEKLQNTLDFSCKAGKIRLALEEREC